MASGKYTSTDIRCTAITYGLGIVCQCKRVAVKGHNLCFQHLATAQKLAKQVNH